MRSITFVQAFQYWLKLTAVAMPAVFVLGLFLSDAAASTAPAPPDVPRRDHRRHHDRRRAAGRRAGARRVDGTVDGVRRAARRRGQPGRHERRRRHDAAVPRRARRCPWSRRHRRRRDWARPGRAPASRDTRSRASTRCCLATFAGHHGPAARAGPLLHQPRRPGGPAHDRRRCSALLGVFYLFPPCSASSRGCTCRSCSSPGDRRRGAAAAAGRARRRPGRELLGALVAAGARSRRSCRRRRGCCQRRRGADHGRAARPAARLPARRRVVAGTGAARGSR